MKESFDEWEVKTVVRNAISNFCRMMVQREACEPDECDNCPMNLAYDMARDEEDGVDEFE